MGLRICLEFFCNNSVDGQNDPAARLSGLRQDRIDGFNQARFAERLTDADLFCIKEGVGHAAADDEIVHLLHKMDQQVDFRRDLRAADDRGHGTFGPVERQLERLISAIMDGPA